MITFNLTQTECSSVPQTVTIVPRLEYSTNLLTKIIENLECKRRELQKSNLLLKDSDSLDYSYALHLESLVEFSLEILYEIQRKIRSISGIKSIPDLLSSTIPMIRAVSARLFDYLPICSQSLCDLSVHLGSIILDSGILTEARFDFSCSNIQSSLKLDEVKLMVDSKISKQYPNFDFFKS